MVSLTPLSIYPWEEDPVSMKYDTGWAAETVWTLLRETEHLSLQLPPLKIHQSYQNTVAVECKCPRLLKS